MSLFLDNASLEEDEEIQDKWAILLSNLVDSEQNIENHVFPYILSQLSKNELTVLDSVYREWASSIEITKKDMLEFEACEKESMDDLNTRLEAVKNILREYNDNKTEERFYEAMREEIRIHTSKSNLRKRREELEASLRTPAYFTNQYDGIEQFEIANLIRLGIVKEEKEFYAKPEHIEIPSEPDSGRTYSSLKVEITIDSETDNLITELGILFIKACKEKEIPSPTS